MVKFRTLKFMARTFIPRNVRCHQRRLFLENLLSPLKEVRDKANNHVSGFIQYNESSFRLACHEIAAEVSYYPFEKRSYINVGEFFLEQIYQNLYTELNVRIIRESPLWTLFLGYGDYEVHAYGLDNRRAPIKYTYTARINLF